MGRGGSLAAGADGAAGGPEHAGMAFLLRNPMDQRVTASVRCLCGDLRADLLKRTTAIIQARAAATSPALRRGLCCGTRWSHRVGRNRGENDSGFLAEHGIFTGVYCCIISLSLHLRHTHTHTLRQYRKASICQATRKGGRAVNGAFRKPLAAQRIAHVDNSCTPQGSDRTERSRSRPGLR